MRPRQWILQWCLFALVAMAFPSAAGEPLLTDDPGTPGPNAWELNVAVTQADFQDSTAWEVPTVNLNYGLGESIEIGATLPILIVDNAGADPKGDLGNTTIGIKWRFLD